MKRPLMKRQRMRLQYKGLRRMTRPRMKLLPLRPQLREGHMARQNHTQPATKPIIDRPTLPIVVRHPRERRPLLLLVALAFLVWLGFTGKDVNFSLPKVALPDVAMPDMTFRSTPNPFVIEAVALRPSTNKNGINWMVSGYLRNKSDKTTKASDLRIRLLRADGSEAASTLLRMQSQLVPMQSALTFVTSLQTSRQETTLSAEVTPLPVEVTP